MTLAIVAAVARDGAIGKGGSIPWTRLKRDMQFFAHVTTALHPEKMAYHFTRYPHTVSVAGGSHSEELWHTAQNACIMGWRTHRSLGTPLTQRTSIVLRNVTAEDTDDGWHCKAGSFNHALVKAAARNAPNVFAIGGTRVFEAALRHCECRYLYLTEIDAEYPDADTFFPWPQMKWDDRKVYCYDPNIYGGLHISGRRWFRRTHVSQWLEEETGPRFRFGIWERAL